MGLGSRTGKVIAYDEGRGLGEVAALDGGVFGFHCTQIADGSRTIEIGVTVRFEVEPGGLGRWEATAITRADTGRG